MDLKYKILSINTEERSIVVRYYTSVVTQDMLASHFDSNNQIIRLPDGSPERCRTDYNITLYEDNLLTDNEALTNNILSAAPTKWLKIKEDVIANTSISTETIENLIGIETETSVNPSLPVISTNFNVTPRQMRLALSQAGLMTAVNDYITSVASEQTKISWEYATIIERDNALIATAATALGKTTEEIDALFELAAAL